jgi:hypothetical protein
LLSRCDEESLSAEHAQDLRAAFSAAATEDGVLQVLVQGQFCRAFALGAADVARREGYAWSLPALMPIGQYCLFNGDLDVANEIGSECLRRAPTDTDAIALWAESGRDEEEVVARYASAVLAAADPDAVRGRAMLFARRSAAPERLYPYARSLLFGASGSADPGSAT